MALCSNCGKEISEGIDCCNYCGQELISKPDKSRSKTPIKKILIVTGIIVVAIGLYLMISIPSWLAYKERSNNSKAYRNLENAIEAQEAFFGKNNTYIDSVEKLVEKPYGFQIIDGVVFSIISANARHYEMEAFHKKGTRLYEVTGPGKIIKKYTLENQKKGKEIKYQSP